MLRDVGDEQLIKDSLAEVAWMKDEFPILKDEKIEIISDPDYKGAYMYSRTDRGTIAFAGFSKDQTASKKNSYMWEAGVKDRNGLTESPAGTSLKHVATHETAHQLVRTVCDRAVEQESGGKVTRSNKKLHESYSEYIVSTAYNSMPRSERVRGGIGTSKGRAASRKQISRYAYSGGYNETVAEAMADYRANGSNAKPLSRAIYRTLKTEATPAGINRLMQ